MKKTITLEDALQMNWCYSETKLKEIAGNKKHWSALDILNLDCIPVYDKIYAVLNPKLIEEHILHEFACRCAERALFLAELRSPALEYALKIKRDWVAGNISDDLLEIHHNHAYYTPRGIKPSAINDVAVHAVYIALDPNPKEAAWRTARDAVITAIWTVEISNRSVREKARNDERLWQIKELTKMLKER